MKTSFSGIIGGAQFKSDIYIVLKRDLKFFSFSFPFRWQLIYHTTCGNLPNPHRLFNHVDIIVSVRSSDTATLCTIQGVDKFEKILSVIYHFF